MAKSKVSFQKLSISVPIAIIIVIGIVYLFNLLIQELQVYYEKSLLNTIIGLIFLSFLFVIILFPVYSFVSKQIDNRNHTNKLIPGSNPYIAGPPITNPKMFFGRQADLEKTIGLVLTGNFVMLIGARRIGKTSLLHQLAHHFFHLTTTPETLVPVLVNVEGVSESEFFHTVMEETISVTKKHLSPEAITNLSFDLSASTYPPRVFSRDLQAILRGLANTAPKPSRLVLLLDEMDTFNKFSLDTQSQLRRIFQRFVNLNLSVVVAGVKLQQRWAGESSPFYNMFIPIILPPLSDAEARRLIIEPVQNVFSYGDEAIARILEVTQGLPHRIQQLCLEIIHHLLVTSSGRTSITIEDVNVVLQAIHWQGEEEDILSTLQEEANRLKDDFFAAMSHELRTPLTAIKGYTDLLRMTAANKLDERELNFIDTIDVNVTQTLNLLQDMLDLSRIEAGGLGISQEPVNLSELIEIKAKEWATIMNEKGVSLNIYSPDDPIWVEGDWYRLTQVMHNLLSNAHNYTFSGGQVEIVIKREGDFGRVDVKDTGVGISETYQPFLFTRFFRAPQEETMDYASGTGLGLYICKAIIEAHHGKIWVESEPNQGSRFSFTLPLMASKG
jgi:signal transduction histidine kinase